MAVTLSFGFVQPETGDKGSVWFPALEDNINQTNNHTHDGVTSSKLSANAIEAVTQDLVSAGWALVSTGTYKQTVTMPGSFQFEDQAMRFLINSGPDIGAQFYPSIVKVSSNTFDLFINDNSVDVRIIYR